MDVYANLSLKQIRPLANVSAVATFGENVRRLRTAAGLEHGRQLAERIGVAPSVVSRWETDATGLPEAPTLLRLAKAVNCTIDELLQGIDEEYEAIKDRARVLYEQSTSRPLMEATLLLER